MKKSEALKIIRDYLITNSEIINEYQVLAIAEKVGMVPKCECSVDYENYYGAVKNSKWEPEDEE